MKITKQARRDAKQLYQACLIKGVLGEDLVRKVVATVLEKKPRGYLATLSQFQRLVKLDLERRSARVFSAQELTPELKSAMEGSLAKIYGDGLQIVWTVKPELIGGLRVQIGSDVYDGSIRNRLDALKNDF